MLFLLLACVSSPGTTADDTGPLPGDTGTAHDGGASDGGASDGGASDGGASDGGASDGGASDGDASDGGSGDGGSGDGGSGDGGDCAVDWYADLDGDGWGGELLSRACEAPTGAVEVEGDCDDADASIHPEAEERCDAVDEDCDGEVDEDAVDATAGFLDLDGDGYGLEELLSCGAEGLVDRGGDCDEADPAVSPAGVETCGDGIDQDCSGRDSSCGIGTVYDVERDADLTFWGGYEQQLGYRLGGGGDFDGDGIDDLVITSLTLPSSGGEGRSGTPAFSVYYGGSLRDGLYGPTELPTKEPNRQKYQADLSADLNGDGVHDLLWVGVTDDDANYALDVVWGGGERWTDGGSIEADVSMTTNVYTHLGQVFAAGDADGDGIDDVLLSRRQGAVLLYGGRDLEDSTIFDHPSLTSGRTWFGDGGLGIADLDGDGLGDLVIADVYAEYTASSMPGALHVVYGDGRLTADVDLETDTDAWILGPTDAGSVLMGTRLATGDLDGDGHDDIAASSIMYGGGAGRTWLYSGGARISGELDADIATATITGDEIPILGVSVAVVPDMDGDADSELLLGASNNGALLFRGSGIVGGMTDADADVGLLGGESDGLNGYAVATGDLDGDSVPDLVTAGYAQDDYRGAVWAFWGGEL